MGIADCSNRGLDSRMAQELVWLLKDYQTIIFQKNFIKCITYGGQARRIILLDNDLDCSCDFPSNAVTGCLSTPRQVTDGTKSTDHHTSAPITEAPGKVVTKSKANQSTKPKSSKGKSITPKITQKKTDGTTERTTTMGMTEPAATGPEPPLLPSYQEKECSIWAFPETYVMMACSLVLGILLTFVIACIRLKCFGNYTFLHN